MDITTLLVELRGGLGCRSGVDRLLSTAPLVVVIINKRGIGRSLRTELLKGLKVDFGSDDSSPGRFLLLITITIASSQVAWNITKALSFYVTWRMTLVSIGALKTAPNGILSLTSPSLFSFTSSSIIPEFVRPVPVAPYPILRKYDNSLVKV